MLQQLEVENCLASLSRSIPTLQWWRFELSKSDHRKHFWISLPADVEVVCGKTSLLPKNSRLLGRLNILHWGADCLVQGVRIAPSEKNQIICLETRASDKDPRVLWIDVNQLVVTISPNGVQEIVDNSRPTQPLLGSHIWGWLSGLKIFCSQPQSITERCFLIPVDFSNRDDIAVLLSHNARSDRVAMREPASPSRKLIVVNPCTNEFYCHLESMPLCQTYSPFGNAESKVKKKEEVAENEEEEEEVAEDEELTFPASMMDEEATKRDTKLSETLVEIEDFACRVIWTIQHPSDGCVGRDANVEAQRCRIAMQLAEMQSCEEHLRIHKSDESLALLEKLLEILTSLLEIGEMVNVHRRRDESCILRLVDQKLSEIASWMDESQLAEGNVSLSQARHALNQLVCIQLAMQVFVGKAKPTANLAAMIGKVESCVGERLESEIQEKLEKGAPCCKISLNAGDILAAFAETMKECLSFDPTSMVPRLETLSTPLQTLQYIRSNLAEYMAVLKFCCGWIPCILNEGIQQSLNNSQELLNDLKAIHDQAFTIYKQLEMYTSLVCEHSGLYTLAIRLTSLLEHSTNEKLSQWQISQLEQELDRYEAECAVEMVSCGKEGREFVNMVIRSLLKHTLAARRVMDGISTIQEPKLLELLERFKSLTSTSNLSSPSTSFEALLIGWYLQTSSITDSQVDGLVCRLEEEVSKSFQDTPLVHLRVSETEKFLLQIPPVCVPCSAKASSLRDALLILSDVILRLNSAVQLLERMAFLTNLHLSQRLETLRSVYPRALEGLTKCFRSLEALLRELSEWRKCIVLVEDSDQHDAATQAVIEVVNFSMNIITQELNNFTGTKFFNAHDLLSEILEWLSSFHSSLIGFREASSQYRFEKSVIYSHSSALLHDLLNLEWLLAESRLQSQRDLAHEIGGTAAGDMDPSWMASIQKMLEEIEPTKRRRLLNLLESMERSSREQRQSLMELLMGSWKMVKSFEGVTLLNYIVTRAEGFADLKVQLLVEKYAKTEDKQSNIYEKSNSNVHGEAFYTLVRNLSEEFRRLRCKQNENCNDFKIAECLRKSEALAKIGCQYAVSSESSLHLIDRVLFSYWPEALLTLISNNQLLGKIKSPADWRICALDFRNAVARFLIKDSFSIAEEGHTQVGTKDADDSLRNLRTAINEADRIFHGIQDGFSVDARDVWKACLQLHNLFQSYTSQLGQQINDLTLPSLCTVKKDLQRLESRISELALGGSSPSALDDCSESVTQLEESLQALRQKARILFTCLATDSKLSPRVPPSKHLDVSELYKRAVKLVNDYEASEIGCQIVEAWQHLQSIADKVGRLQAGLPITESFANYNAMTVRSPMVSTRDLHLDGFSNASMARKRSWSLLEILGSHECLYPGCRGKKRDKSESHITDDGLLHDLHEFYSLLCSEFHDRAMRIPVEVLISSTQKAASTEIALINLRQEWHRDTGLVNKFNSLQRRAKFDGSVRSEVKSSFGLIEAIWGETNQPKVFFEAAERLATVSSWLREVERHLDLDVLPRLQTAWKSSAGTDTLSVVEECVYKMNEITEDLQGLEKSGILAERRLKTVKHSLQVGWFNVREFLLSRCVKPAFHEDPTSARYFPLVDDFLRHSAELGFQDCGLKSTHTRLCNQYLLHGLTQRGHHPVDGGRKFCSTNRFLRLMFLPSWLTERCRIVQQRPSIALTIHSIPDISTEMHPPLPNAADMAFLSTKCAMLQSRRWFSLPDIRSQGSIHRDYKDANILATEDDMEINSSQNRPNEVEMKTSQLSFSALPSEDEKTEEEKEEEEDEEEPTIAEDSKDSALMGDVQFLLAQLRSQCSPKMNMRDFDTDKRNPEPAESQERAKGKGSTTPPPSECRVSRKLRNKSPITWCTVYLPNDEEAAPSVHSEAATERGVVQIASDPLLPKCELYAPMVFSAPYEVSDQEDAGIANQERVADDVGGVSECNPSLTDESGVCDWLRKQQAENIERLMKECEADDDGDKGEMPLMDVDDPSSVSGFLAMSYSGEKNSSPASVEESGFGDNGWSRGDHEGFIQRTSYSIFAGGTEDHSFIETKGSHVNWGPLVERPESPHLSVISEASTDESALEKRNSISGKVLNSPPEVYAVEEHNDNGEWKTVASKKSRSGKKAKSEKKRQKDCKERNGLASSPPKSSIHLESGNEYALLTPPQKSCVFEDGSQRIQEGDSEEDTDKTISEALLSEYGEEENELAKSSSIAMKNSSIALGDSNAEAEQKGSTDSEDMGSSTLMRDARLPLAQRKSQHSPMAETMDAFSGRKNPEPVESQERAKGKGSTTPPPSECRVSRKLRNKSPITWCTVYLPNDEEAAPSIHSEAATERGVVQIASDPLLPKCELYAPMVFSAPYEVSDQEDAGIANQERVADDVGGVSECNPSLTDESGVCDWLRKQQAENIERLMKECEADDDGDKGEMPLMDVDDPSSVSGLLAMPFPRTNSSVSNSFEESGLGDEEWSRKSLEFPSQQTSYSVFVRDVEDYIANEVKGGRVDWGPLAERLGSPHLSVISEASTDESALGTQQYIDKKAWNSSQEASVAEEFDNPNGFKSLAPKKTRSCKNRGVTKNCEEVEEVRAQKFPFFSRTQRHGDLTPGFVAKDESQRTTGDDSDENTDRTVSEGMSSDAGAKEVESAESSRIFTKSSVDSDAAANNEVEPNQVELVGSWKEYSGDNDKEGLTEDTAATRKTSSQATEKNGSISEAGFHILVEDERFEKSGLLEVGNEKSLELRSDPGATLLQQDAGIGYRQVGREVSIQADELSPCETVSTGETKEQEVGEDLDRQSSAKLGGTEEIDGIVASNSTKVKKKTKKSLQKKGSKDQLKRVSPASELTTSSLSTVEQEDRIPGDYTKGKDLSNRLQNADEFIRESLMKPNTKKGKKRRGLKYGSEVSKPDDLSTVEGCGNRTLGACVKSTRKAQENAAKELSSNHLQGNLSHSNFAGMVGGKVDDEYVHNGILEYVPLSDDEVKQEGSVKQEHEDEVEIGRVEGDTKATKFGSKKRVERGKATESLPEGEHSAYVNEPVVEWNGNQSDPAMFIDELGRHEMDQSNRGEDLELNNKEVSQKPLHLGGLRRVKANQVSLNEEHSTIRSGGREARGNQVAEPAVDTRDSNDFIFTLKDYTCQDPEQSVYAAPKMNDSGSQSEDMRPLKKGKKKNKRYRNVRHFDNEAGNKGISPSVNQATSGKDQVGNEAVFIANELKPLVGEGGLGKESNDQLDVSDLGGGSPSYLEENYNSDGRKFETGGDDLEEDGNEEKVNLDEAWKPCKLEKTDEGEDFVASKEFKISARETEFTEESDKLHQLTCEPESKGVNDELKEYAKEDEETWEHPAEECSTWDEIDRSKSFHEVAVVSPLRAPVAQSVESEKRKHRQRGHLIDEAETKEYNSSVVSDSQEDSSIEAEVDLKTSKETVDSGCPVQSEEVKDQKSTPEMEGNPARVLDEILQPIEPEMTDQPDEPQTNEFELEVTEENRIMSSEQGEEFEEHLLTGCDGEDANVELSPQANNDALRINVKVSAEPQEHSAEERTTPDEIYRSETVHGVVDLLSAGELEAPSTKNNKRKKHRKGRHLTNEFKVENLPASTVSALQNSSSRESEVDFSTPETIEDVGYPVKSAEAKGTLSTNDDDEELVLGTGKQPTVVIDEVSHPGEHESVVNRSTGQLKDHLQTMECELEVQNKPVDVLKATNKVSDVESLHEAKSHSLKQEDRSDVKEEHLEDEISAEDTDGGLRTPMEKDFLEEYVREEPEAQEVPAEDHKILDAINQSEITPKVVASPSPKLPEVLSMKGGKRSEKHRKARKNIVEVESQGLDGSALPTAKVMTGMKDETQFKCELDVQGMTVAQSKPPSVEEDERKWNHEESKSSLSEVAENESKPQNNKGTSRGRGDKGDKESFKESTEGSCNGNNIVGSRAIEDVNNLSHSQKPKSHLVKRKEKIKRQKRKWLLHENEMVLREEPSMRPETDKEVLDVAVDDQGFVTRTSEHPTDTLEEFFQSNEQEFPVNEPFSYRNDKPQTIECELKVQGNLIDESKGTGEANEFELHPVDEFVEVEARRISDTLPSPQEVEGLFTKFEEQKEPQGDGYFHDEADAQDPKISTAPLLGKMSTVDNEGEIKSATASTDEHKYAFNSQEEISLSKGHEPVVNKSLDPVKNKLQITECNSETQGKSEAGEFELQTKKQHEEGLFQAESNVEGVRGELRPRKNDDTVSEYMKEDSEHRTSSSEGHDNSDEINQSEAGYEVIDSPFAGELEALSVKGGKKTKQRKNRHIIGEPEAENCPVSTPLASPESSSMEADTGFKTSLQTKVAEGTLNIVEDDQEPVLEIKRGKRKKHKKEKQLTSGSKVEDRLASTNSALQDSSSMGAKVDFSASEATEDAGNAVQCEEAEDILDIADGGEKPVFEMEKQPTVVIDEVSHPDEHEFTTRESAKPAEYELQLSECKSEVIGETLNESKGFSTDNAAEQLNANRTRSSGQEDFVEQPQGESCIESVGGKLQPQTNDDVFGDSRKKNSDPQEHHTEFRGTLDEIDQSGTTHGIGALPPVGLPIKAGKKKKPERRHIEGEAEAGTHHTSAVIALPKTLSTEGEADFKVPEVNVDVGHPTLLKEPKDMSNVVVDDQELVSEFEEQADNFMKEALQPTHNFVANDLPTIKGFDVEVLEKTVDETRAGGKVDGFKCFYEGEAFSLDHEGEKEGHPQEKGDAEDANNELQLRKGEPSLEECINADSESRECSAKIDPSQTLQKVVDVSFTEEFKAPSMKDKKKKKKRRKGRSFTSKAEVEDRPASIALASQGLPIMAAEGDLKSLRATASVWHPLQSEGAEGTLKMVDGGQESVPEIKFQPIIVPEGASQVIHCVSVMDEPTVQMVDASHIEESDSQVEGEAFSDDMDRGKADGLENSHGSKALPVDQGKKEQCRDEGKEWETKIATESTDNELHSQGYAPKIGQSLSNLDAFETLHNVDDVTSSPEPEALPVRREKRKKQRKDVFLQDERVVPGAETVVGNGRSLNITMEDDVSSSDHLEEVAHSVVVGEESDHGNDVSQFAVHAPSVPHETAINEAAELEPYPGEQEPKPMRLDGEAEKRSDESEDGQLQLHCNKEIFRQLSDEDEKFYENSTKVGDKAELIGESEGVQMVDVVASSGKPEEQPLEEGRRAKHRTKGHLNDEVVKAQRSPTSQETFRMSDAADLKAFKEAADVRCPMQSEEGGVDNAAQPQAAEEDLNNFTGETEGPQEHPQEGDNPVDETVERETSLQKLELSYTNQEQAEKIGKEHYQKRKSVSLLEEHLLQSPVGGVNVFRDVVPQKDPSPEVTEIAETWEAGEVDSTSNNCPLSDESASTHPKYEDSLELEKKGLSQDPAMEYDSHLSESRDSSDKHVKSGFKAPQARLVIEEFPLNQVKEEPGRMEPSKNCSDDGQLPNSWVPTPLLPDGSYGRFTRHEPDLDNLMGKISRVSEPAVSGDLTVKFEATHLPDVSCGPKVDDSLSLPRDFSLYLDEGLPQAVGTTETGEEAAVTECKSFQKHVPMSPDISTLLDKESPKLITSQKPKDCSEKQSKTKKKPKKKSIKCRGPLQVVDFGIDEHPTPQWQKETMSPSPPQESELSSAKHKEKNKKHRNEEYAKDVHMTENDSKLLSGGEETEKYPMDKEVRDDVCVQVTPASPTLEEAGESFAEYVDDTNVRLLSSDFEGRSPANAVEMEYQKEPKVESEVRRAAVDELVGNKEEKDEGNLEIGPYRAFEEFGESPIGMDSKVQEANLSPILGETVVSVPSSDEFSRRDERKVINCVEAISDESQKLLPLPTEEADNLEDTFVPQAAGASLDRFTSPEPPISEIQGNKSHQGSGYTVLGGLIPAIIDLGGDSLQQGESSKVVWKDADEGESKEPSVSHFIDSTPDASSTTAVEGGKMEEGSVQHDECLRQTGSVHETEVFNSNLICTDLPFPQEPDGRVPEPKGNETKHRTKEITLNATDECLTSAVEADRPHECVEPVDENGNASKVVDKDEDLLIKDVPQQEVGKSGNAEFSPHVGIQGVRHTPREPDSGGWTQGAITNIKTEEEFPLKSSKQRRNKGKMEEAKSSSAICPPETSHLSKSRQRRLVSLQETEKGDDSIATGLEQSLSVEAPVEGLLPDITSKLKEGDVPSPGPSTETVQPPELVTSSSSPSPRKADVKVEPCVEADVEIGRQDEVENAEEPDEDSVTSTDHSLAFLELSPSDTDDVDDFAVVVKLPPPRAVVEAEAPAEPTTMPSRLQISVRPRRRRWPGSFLLLLLFLLFFLIPTIIIFCIAAPDFCFLPGPCPGLTLRQRINAYINDYHRQRLSPFPT